MKIYVTRTTRSKVVEAINLSDFLDPELRLLVKQAENEINRDRKEAQLLNLLTPLSKADDYISSKIRKAKLWFEELQNQWQTTRNQKLQKQRFRNSFKPVGPASKTNLLVRNPIVLKLVAGTSSAAAGLLFLYIWALWSRINSRINFLQTTHGTTQVDPIEYVADAFPSVLVNQWITTRAVELLVNSNIFRTRLKTVFSETQIVQLISLLRKNAGKQPARQVDKAQLGAIVNELGNVT